MTVDVFKRCWAPDLGVGGMKCRCCAPKPGKFRKQVRRMARRRLRQLDRLAYTKGRV